MRSLHGAGRRGGSLAKRGGAWAKRGGAWAKRGGGLARRGVGLARKGGAWAALLVTLGLTACSSSPPVRYYQLAPQGAPAVPGTSGGGLRLGVEPFRVDPPYDQARIVYRVASKPNEVGFYAYHRWDSPLSGMLARASARLLGERPGVAIAEPADPDGAYDLVVQGRLLALEEVDLPGREQAHVELELILQNPRAAAPGAELWRGRFEATKDGDAEDVAGVVDLMESALADALGRGADALAQHLPRPAPR